MRLSLEVAPVPEGMAEVLMYVDEAGRDYLVSVLNRLEFPRVDHEHILSEEWSGNGELTIERTKDHHLAVHHLKVLIRPSDEALFTPSSEA